MESLAAPLLACVLAVLACPNNAVAQNFDWSVGGYGGRYYDSEPAGFLEGRANYLNQSILALNASKTVWRAQDWPLSLELDGIVGQQFGMESLTEIALVPVLRWGGFPWNHLVNTAVRVGPLGISYTSKVSDLERGIDGKGSQFLNYLMLEVAVSHPQHKAHEFFARLHHRCTVYDLLNNYGANGQDFAVLGYRHRF